MGVQRRKTTPRRRDLARSLRDESVLLPAVKLQPEQKPWCKENSCARDDLHRHGIHCSETCSVCDGRL